MTLNHTLDHLKIKWNLRLADLYSSFGYETFVLLIVAQKR